MLQTKFLHTLHELIQHEECACIRARRNSNYVSLEFQRQWLTSWLMKSVFNAAVTSDFLI